MTSYKILLLRFPNFLDRGPFWFQNITTYPHIPAHINVVCPDNLPPGAKAPRGLGPPHYLGFTITLRHTTLLWTSD